MKTQLLTVDQVAQQWGVSRRTIYNAITRGHLAVVRIEGCTRIAPADVEAYLRTHRQPVVEKSDVAKECRRAFYAGAHHLLCIVTAIGDDSVPEDAGVDVLAALHEESEKFKKDVVEGRL